MKTSLKQRKTRIWRQKEFKMFQEKNEAEVLILSHILLNLILKKEFFENQEKINYLQGEALC